MKVSHRKVGLGIVAVAAVLIGSAVLADNSGKPGVGGPQMGQQMGQQMEMRGPMGMMFNFAEADANHDGKLTPEEFAAYRAARVGAIDTDKDGKISVEELASMNLKAMQDIAQARAERMVKALDTDGDGKLSAAELLAMPVPPDAFAMIDTNKDGVIDQAEADAAHKMMQHGMRDGMRGGMGGHWMKHHWMHGADAGDAQGMDDQNGSGGN